MAIAFDAASTGGLVTTSTLTVSHTTSGSDRLLVVAVASNIDQVTGVTYAGVSMSLAAKKAYSSPTETIYIYYLAGPASGTNDIVVSRTGTSSYGLVAASYTGVDQTTPVDATNTGTNAVGTSSTLSVTSTVDNCWNIMMFGLQRGTTAGTGVGATRGSVPTWNLGYFDTNAAISPAGSNSMTCTHANIPVGRMQGVNIAIAPVSAASPTNNALFFGGGL